MSTGEKIVIGVVAVVVIFLWLANGVGQLEDCERAFTASKTASDSINIVRANDTCGRYL